MNLKWHLLSRIAIAAVLCLSAMSYYALQRSAKQVNALVDASADSLARQLDYQLLMERSGYPSAAGFPDFELWKQTSRVPGLCVGFETPDGRVVRHVCTGAALAAAPWPVWFDVLYRHGFGAEPVGRREVGLNSASKGKVVVEAGAELTVARAWATLTDLAELSALTVLTISGLVYLAVGRALRPAGDVAAGLARLARGELDYRLPDYALLEWRLIGAAINRLADSQQRLLSERQRLAARLLQVQEDERRHLARELHDDFGQALAAINAVNAAIAQTARRDCPELLAETERIARYTRGLHDGLRGLTTRLRPAELDELGLAAALAALVRSWQRPVANHTRYALKIDGDCRLLSADAATAIYRLVQEGINNIAKHSGAGLAEICLTITERAELTISDDGCAEGLPFKDGPGIGLVGMRERVTALGGRFELVVRQPRGLRVRVSLPLPEQAVE
ncbi:sensor histidine kinase [Methylococcaceae bacterium WWC4]|nr:sensor histidine kinase [Methylococcaceae bacterium WWC4]